MGDNKSVIDFSLVDTDLHRSPNDIPMLTDPDDYVEADKTDMYIPETIDDAPPVSDKSNKIDPQVIKLLLNEASNNAGVEITDHLTVTATALSHTFGLEPHSMDWFLAGISYANNSMITEKLVSIVKDLQIEVRNLQSASSSITQTSGDFMGKMNRNKREIIEEMDKTRDSVLKSIRDVYAGNMMEKTNAEDLVDLTEALSTQGENEGTVGASPIDPILKAENLSAKIPTLSPEEALVKKKKTIMAELGFELTDINSLGSAGVDMLIQDDVVLMHERGFNDEEKDLVFQGLLDIILDSRLA
nr:TPA_asm: P [Morinda alphacytorhabdovirus 1_Mor]